jgi:hypothetical protein
MEAAGVTGGLPALRLLSQLLFGGRPPRRHPSFGSIPPPDEYGLGITVGGRVGGAVMTGVHGLMEW